MNTSRTTRFVSLVTVAAAAVLNMSIADAAPKPGTPVLDGVVPAASVTLPARAKAASGVVGALNGKALGASALEFKLADGQTITAELQRVARDDQKATQSWIGTFADSPGSLVVLSKVKGVVTGYGTYQDKTFEVLPVAGGKHLLFEIDDARLPQGKDPVEKSVAGAAELYSTGLTESGTTATTATTAGAVVHDVLVVYTSTSAARWGAATLQSMIQNAIQAGNQAYINSHANITVNVVAVKQVAMKEAASGGMMSTMNTLVKDPEVQGLRKSLYADMVVLVSEDSNYCGYAKLTNYYTNGVVTWWDANAIVYSNCLSNQTVAHELGHLQGLDHNKENTAYSGWYPYSYGYRRCTTDGFIDVMSYSCSGAPKISVFSNPSVTYNGYATGVAGVADTARTLNETATTVAGYMKSSSTTETVPAAPSSLAVSSAAYNSVGLTWLDNATNESGYKVERSPDGVTFTERASL
ncbi:MAG TPA: M12 family metallo-peptidase, partial [Steroidobacteraceae bacterium]